MNTEMRELVDCELDAVTGGTLAEFLGHVTNAVIAGTLETACVVLQGAVTVAKAITN